MGEGEVRKHGVRLKLQRQPFEILAALLERPGAVVTRDELRKRLWPDGVFVDYDRGLNKAVNRLREVLDDNVEQPRFIETVPQRGYRFIGAVERDEPAESPIEPKIPKVNRSRLAVWVALVVSLAVAGLYRWRVAPPARITTIAVLPLENLSGGQEQEFFADGMTDELIGEMAHISSLHVISRTSVMRYKGGVRKSLPEIARERNADAILEGTVTKLTSGTLQRRVCGDDESNAGRIDVGDVGEVSDGARNSRCLQLASLFAEIVTVASG